MNEFQINRAIGELLIKEKYKFLPSSLVAEVARDFVKEYEKSTKNGNSQEQETKGGSASQDSADKRVNTRSPDTIHQENKRLLDKDYDIDENFRFVKKDDAKDKLNETEGKNG